MLEVCPGMLLSVICTWHVLLVMTCHSNDSGQELTFENIKQGGDQECPKLGKNIGTSDYEVVARGDVEQPNNVPDTVFVEVVVTVSKNWIVL